MFCNAESVGNRCQTEWCECVHKLTVTQHDVVEMVFISPSGEGFTHPVHVHGFSYRVVAMDRVRERWREGAGGGGGGAERAERERESVCVSV